MPTTSEKDKVEVLTSSTNKKKRLEITWVWETKDFQYVVILPANGIVSFNIYFLFRITGKKNDWNKNWGYNDFERISLRDRLGIPCRKEFLGKWSVQPSLPSEGISCSCCTLEARLTNTMQIQQSSGQSILLALPVENFPTVEDFLETCLFLFMVFPNEMENSSFPSSLQQFLIYSKTYYIYSPNNPNFFSHSL